VPSIHESGKVAKHKERATEFTWTVPVDNTEITSFSIIAWPAVNGVPIEGWQAGTDVKIGIRPASQMDRSYEERQRAPDDREAQEGQRPIAVHALEHLATSDVGIVQLRRMLRDQLTAIKEGRDPINVFRDCEGQTIETHAWNTVLSPQEAAMHQGGEA